MKFPLRLITNEKEPPEGFKEAVERIVRKHIPEAEVSITVRLPDLRSSTRVLLLEAVRGAEIGKKEFCLLRRDLEGFAFGDFTIWLLVMSPCETEQAEGRKVLSRQALGLLQASESQAALER